jgi:hypothetical protein
MMRRYRRAWILIAAALMAVPLTASIASFQKDGMSADELRLFEPRPSIPKHFSEWSQLPGHVDAYLRDHFGLRQSLIWVRGKFASLVPGSIAGQVFVGLDGWMFVAGWMIPQSAGATLRLDEIRDTADCIKTIHAAAAAQGIKMIVAFPPNPSTIYPDKLPEWARSLGGPTEYDLLVRALMARDVPVIDLRPALEAARAQGQTYHQHDTHWNARGALAAFNTMALAAGHPDWRVDPLTALGPERPFVGGDLARMLGVPQDPVELDEPLMLSSGNYHMISRADDFLWMGSNAENAGPSVMIVGDSFAVGLFPPMILQHANRVVYQHYRGGDFEWKWIEKFASDEIWYMPTEKEFFCAAHPRDMPKLGPAATAARVVQQKLLDPMR